jgi:hypothetical protein
MFIDTCLPDVHSSGGAQRFEVGFAPTELGRILLVVAINILLLTELKRVLVSVRCSRAVSAVD